MIPSSFCAIVFNSSFSSPTGMNHKASEFGRRINPHSPKSALGSRAPVAEHILGEEASATAHGFSLSRSMSSFDGCFFLIFRNGFRAFVIRGDWGSSRDGRTASPSADALLSCWFNSYVWLVCCTKLRHCPVRRRFRQRVKLKRSWCADNTGSLRKGWSVRNTK
jgi:hypothetical protein